MNTPCIDHGKSGGQHGYNQARVKIGGVWRNRQRHRLVYAASIGVDELTMEGVVRHLCHNTRCINVEHLVLGTVQDNSDDMTSAGRQSRGAHRPLSKLSEEQVLEIRNSSEAPKVIGARMGVNRSTITRIRAGMRWHGMGKDGRWVGAK